MLAPDWVYRILNWWGRRETKRLERIRERLERELNEIMVTRKQKLIEDIRDWEIELLRMQINVARLKKHIATNKAALAKMKGEEDGKRD